MKIVKRLGNLAVPIAEKQLLGFLNKHFVDYGSFQSLKIDFVKKTIAIECLLLEEKSVVKIKLVGVKIVFRDGVYYLEINEAETSRKWLTNLLNDLNNGKFGDHHIIIPSKMAILLKPLF
ncbi:MAG: hypothetical protein K8S56_00975 [Candidatus Cloacimonetes bacterium]|nr:hypothetical protein [Candidatus Cloacimonadota bacterium]